MVTNSSYEYRSMTLRAEGENYKKNKRAKLRNNRLHFNWDVPNPWKKRKI
jgi:hypothetical protein